MPQSRNIATSFLHQSAGEKLRIEFYGVQNFKKCFGLDYPDNSIQYCDRVDSLFLQALDDSPMSFNNRSSAPQIVCKGD